MALSLTNDSRMPDGGYAILTGPGLEGVSALSVENCFSGMFLGEDGGWAKTPFACPVEPVDGQPDALSLGPHIVDFVPTDLQVAFRTETGQDLGKVFWGDVIPSRNNPGWLTSAQVLQERASRIKTIVDVPETPKLDDSDPEAQKVDPPKLVPPKPVLPKPSPPDPKPTRRFPVWLAILAIALVAGGLVWRYWPPPTPPAPKIDLPKVDTPPVKPAHHQDAPLDHPPEQHPPEQHPPVVQPRPPVTNPCPATPSEAYDQGLETFASDEPHDLRESERLLTCAMKGGVPEARHKLGRLYLKMATSMSGSFDEARGFYKKACDMGEQEGCTKFNFKLDR